MIMITEACFSEWNKLHEMLTCISAWHPFPNTHQEIRTKPLKKLYRSGINLGEAFLGGVHVGSIRRGCSPVWRFERHE
jgi:hypothetical protein